VYREPLLFCANIWRFRIKTVLLQLFIKKSAMMVCLLLALSLLAGCLKDEVGGVRLSNDEPVEMYSVPKQLAMMLS
jgi:hypothetical protein